MVAKPTVSDNGSQLCRASLHRHCEERSDEAIQRRALTLWIASLRAQGRGEVIWL